MFNIKPADRWVGEVEHFFQMVENHKKVPYRGVFGVKPRDPEARVDPPSAEKMRASRASKRPASAAGRLTSGTTADNLEETRPQTAPSSQAQREAVAEQLYRRMLRGRGIEGAQAAQADLQPRTSTQRAHTTGPRSTLGTRTAKLSPARKTLKTRQKTQVVTKCEHLPGIPSVNPPPPRPPHLDPIRGCLSKNLRELIESKVTVLELAEMYSIQKPPKPLEALMDCVCVLFGLEPSWMSAHTNLLRNLYAFHSRLLHFERNSLSLQRRLLFCRAVDKMDKHCQAIEKVSRAAVGLHEWVMCIHTYYTAPTHCDAFTEDRDPLAYLSRLLTLEQQQAHASHHSTPSGNKKVGQGRKTTLPHAPKKEDGKTQQQSPKALEPAVPVAVETPKPRPKAVKQVEHRPPTRQTQSRTHAVPPPVSTAPQKVNTKAVQATRQQPASKLSPMSTASSKMDNLSQAPATSAPALSAAKPPSAQEDQLELPDKLDAVSVCGSVEADELLDPYLLSPGSVYDDDDFALSVPSTPVAQGRSPQQDNELGLVEDRLIPAAVQDHGARSSSKLPDSESMAEPSKAGSSGDYTLDYEEVATRASAIRRSEGGQPQAADQVAEAHDAEQSVASSHNTYGSEKFGEASVPDKAVPGASQASRDGSSSEAYASESFEQATAAPTVPPTRPEEDDDVFNGFSVDDEVASEAIQAQQSSIYSSDGDQEVSAAPASVAYSIEAEQGAVDQQHSTAYSTDPEQEAGEEQSASYSDDMTGVAEGQAPVASVATSNAGYHDEGFDDDESLSMTGAARVVGDAAKAAAASPEDERTQAAYEEEFEEESVRSRPPVEHKTIPVAASESEVDYDINLEEDE